MSTQLADFVAHDQARKQGSAAASLQALEQALAPGQGEKLAEKATVPAIEAKPAVAVPAEKPVAGVCQCVYI